MPDFSLFARFFKHLPREFQREIVLFLFLSILTSFLEVLSIGSVLPLLGVLTSPETVFKIELLIPIYHYLGIQSSADLLLPITVLFASFALFAGIARISILSYSTKLSFRVSSVLSLDIYKKTLYQPYYIHISRNNSEVISGIINKANGVMGSLMQPTLGLINSGIMLITILFAVIAINPVIAIGTFFSFGVFYFIIAFYSKETLTRNGKVISLESNNVLKVLNEGLGGIRDILLDGTQKVYYEIYEKSDYLLRKASASNYLINNSPRLVIEVFGMILISAIAYILSDNIKGGLTSSAIPLLGSLALAAQRLLPVMQQAYSSWSILRSSRHSLLNVLELLEQPMPIYSDTIGTGGIVFSSKLELVNICFKYSNSEPYVLKNISFDILKGSKIGIIGKTGSGKSTLTDIIMGLLTPFKGKIFVDNIVLTMENIQSWQKNIAHVPQNIFFSDATIIENIAFGVKTEDIDFNKVKESARKAQISEFIESLKDGYNTMAGERGVRFSGGQKQRIGIARALYKNASLIIFDEATSALDNETEKSVMEAIENLEKDLTIIIIAHRLSTIKNCDFIIELNKGEVLRKGNYRELFME
ncbi:MAG: ABC transporter ATP-binding protein/permease [Leptospiraceae bacterium]|nr:ABC transporter ATP-binding protein [Leptospiraceae bacterium]MCK6382080.1 ABC transporter ATP-binding protein/permease [Leptospiraceae bacterium]